MRSRKGTAVKNTPRESQPVKLPAVPSYLYVVMYAPGDGRIPEYLRGFWTDRPGRQDWVYFAAHAVGFNTKSKAEKVAFDIAVADEKKLGKLFVERWKSNYVGTSEEKLSGLSY